MRPDAGIRRSRACSAGLSDRRSAANAVLLSRSQERPSSEVKIGEAAGDEQPVGILVQPAIAHLRESKHALDDPDTMLDLRPYLRLGPIASFLCLIDNTAMTISPVGEVLCRWSMLADDMTLATIGLVAPDTPFLAMEQVTPQSPPRNGSAWSCYRPRHAPSSRNITAGPCGSGASRGRAALWHSWSNAGR